MADPKPLSPFEMDRVKQGTKEQQKKAAQSMRPKSYEPESGVTPRGDLSKMRVKEQAGAFPHTFKQGRRVFPSDHLPVSKARIMSENWDREPLGAPSSGPMTIDGTVGGLHAKDNHNGVKAGTRTSRKKWGDGDAATLPRNEIATRWTGHKEPSAPLVNRKVQNV